MNWMARHPVTLGLMAIVIMASPFIAEARGL